MNIKIPQSTEQLFKEFVLARHGKLRGVLSSEINRAMLKYVKEEKLPKSQKKLTDKMKSV